MRLHVVSNTEGASIPFLRGILTRSLLKAGLPFDDAYEIASDVRDLLQDKEEIAGDALRKVVVQLLKTKGREAYVESYLGLRLEADGIRVLTSDGSDAPFSKGQLADSLEICALPRETLYDLAIGIEAQLVEADQTEITSRELTELVLEALESEIGKSAADDYRRWVEFSHSGKPLVILIGGTTGSGKSSVSSELAHRLDIVRTQSTDMLREVMRLLVPERLVPTIHTSSFEAFEKMPAVGRAPSEKDMVKGYLAQSSQVAVGIEGVLNRTANESVSLIIEGVHLHPRLMAEIAERSDCIVVPVLLSVLKAKRLKKRLIGRGHLIQSRRSERYIKNFDRIWNLQSFLLDEADDFDIAIIPNNDEETAVRAVLQTVSGVLRKEMEEKAQPPDHP